MLEIFKMYTDNIIDLCMRCRKKVLVDPQELCTFAEHIDLLCFMHIIINS